MPNLPSKERPLLEPASDLTLAHDCHLLQLEWKTTNLLPRKCPVLEPALDPTLAYDCHLPQLVHVLADLACPNLETNIPEKTLY